MPEGRISTWWILRNILALSLMLFVFVEAVKHCLKAPHREYQDLVLISGVIDSLKRVRTGDFETRYLPPASYEVRLTLQRDQHLYVVKDEVYPALDWQKFNTTEYVSDRVSLRVERAQLVSKSFGRLKPSYYSDNQLLGAVDVYGLESSRGIYLTPEDSLKELRDEDYWNLKAAVIAAVVTVLAFLWVLRIFVSGIWYPSSYWGRYARSKSFRRREDRMREGY